MNSTCNKPNVNHCSFCNTLLNEDSKLLICLHGICNDCVAVQSNDSVLGVKCYICEAVTDSELFEFLNTSSKSQISKKSNCGQEPIDTCCVDRRQTNNEHQQYKNLFETVQCEITQCPNCINKRAEFLCTQCLKIHCADCHIMNHNGHDYKFLENIVEDTRCEIISAKHDLVSNSTYIDRYTDLTESYISEIKKNVYVTKAKIDKQWEMVQKEMMYCKNQINNAVEELYEERVSEVNKNKSTLQKLKIKNDYYINFASSIIHHYTNNVNIKLAKTIKDKLIQLKNESRICNSTIELLPNIKPDFMLTNFIKSTDEIIKVIKSVERVTSPPIFDLSNFIGVKMSTENIVEQNHLDNCQLSMESPHSNLVINEEENILSSAKMDSSRLPKDESSMDIVYLGSDHENEEKIDLFQNIHCTESNDPEITAHENPNENKITDWFQNHNSIQSNVPEFFTYNNPDEKSYLDINNLEHVPMDEDKEVSTTTRIISCKTAIMSTNLIEIPVEHQQINEEIYTSAKYSGLAINLECVEPIVVISNESKVNKMNQRRYVQGLRSQICKKWAKTCSHKDASLNKCKVALLTQIDIESFKNNLCLINKKIDQDKLLLNMMTIKKSKRKNQNNKFHRKKIIINYFIPTEKGDLINVCLNAFVRITSITYEQLNTLASKCINTVTSSIESRGGLSLSRQLKSDEITISIKKHILRFKRRKTQYVCSDTGRSYLQPELSVMKMWNHWTSKRKSLQQPLASLSKYFKVFTKKFNIGFGHPRQDECSFCTQKCYQMKNEKDDDVKNILMFELKDHKEKSNFFSKMVNNKYKDNSVHVSFDMMQNQPLPKLSVTKISYSRQAWLYNLIFIINSEKNQSKENRFLYTWLETEGSSGPNEIGSALLHFLNIIENRYKGQEKPPTILNLYSDSCSTHNKNQFIMAILLNYINCTETIFEKINHIFPVRGHSYMSPDRVFSRTEEELKKNETIISPTQYHTIFSNFYQVFVYGKDFLFYNIKEAYKGIIKPNIFKMTEQKRLQYVKNKKTVGLSTNYTGEYDNYINVLQTNSKIEEISNLPILEKSNHVIKPKQDDIKKLMEFFNIPIDAIDFYNDIFNTNAYGNNDEDIHDNGATTYLEDSIY